MDPDPGVGSYISVPLMSQEYQHADPRYATDPYMVSFDHYDPYLGYPPQPGYPGPHGIYMPRSHSPHSPHSPSEHSRASPTPHGKLNFHSTFYFPILVSFPRKVHPEEAVNVNQKEAYFSLFEQNVTC